MNKELSRWQEINIENFDNEFQNVLGYELTDSMEDLELTRKMVTDTLEYYFNCAKSPLFEHDFPNLYSWLLNKDYKKN